MERLEEESTAAKHETQAAHSELVAALKAEHSTALAEVRSSHERYAARYREAASALAATQERADAADSALLELRRDGSTRNATITWLESQVDAAREVSSEPLTILCGAASLILPVVGACTMQIARVILLQATLVHSMLSRIAGLVPTKIRHHI